MGELDVQTSPNKKPVFHHMLFSGQIADLADEQTHEI